MKLKLGDGLTLPLDIAGQTVALVGIRGSGKTNTAGVIAEELLDRHQPLVVIDPTDAWWGLRSDYPVFIFGGPHGDLPLQETDGKTIAGFVVQEQVPLILSLRHLRKNAQRRLVTEFCEELYHLKGKPEYRSPLTVFVDEAPLFVPQRVMGEVARTVGAVEDLIARGRNSGFGVVLISQRSATLNKDVLTQADTIIAHRLPSPQDRKALAEWIEENASVEELRAVLSSLPGLKTGEAWVWAPRLDIFRQAQIRARRTFDSSASPKVGETLKPPKVLTAVDLERLRGKLSEAIEKAKADDPRELRRQIADLQKQLRAPQLPAPKVETKTVEKFVLKDGQLARLEKLYERLFNEAERHAKALGLFWDQQTGEAKALLNVLAMVAGEQKPFRPADVVPIRNATATAPRREPLTPTNSVGRGRTVSPPVRPAREVAEGNGHLSGVSQRILNALAELEQLGAERPSRELLAFLAGYTNLNSKGFANGIGALRTGGYIAYPDSGSVEMTEHGRAHAEYPEAPRSPEDVQQRIISLLGGASAKILRPLIHAYPKAMAREDLAAAADYTNLNSKGFANAIGRLRTLGFIDYPDRGTVKAQPVLFLES